jgi:hypothetical protein
MKISSFKTNTFLLTIVLLLFISITTQSQTIEVSGNISQNTIWEADTVKIIDNVFVLEEARLSIMPGTYVEAQGFFKIQVSGSIWAIGSISDSIYFTVADTTGFWPDTTSNTGGWDGIHIENNPNGISKFEYCNMAFGKQFYPCPNYPEYMGGAFLRVKNYGSLLMKNNYCHDNMLCFDAGVAYNNSGGFLFCQDVNTIDIRNNIFTKNRVFAGGASISVETGCPNTIISDNTFLNNVAYFYEVSGGWITQGGYAAAILCSDDFEYSPIISGNKCFNNFCFNGVIYTSNLNPIVYNNIVCNNDGSGILDGHMLGHGKIFNNISVNNISHANGGIALFSKAQIYNNIVWGNYWKIPESNYQIYIYDYPEVDPTLFNNCVEFGRGGTDSITAYPQFANPTEGPGRDYDGLAADWTLLETSPCINKGTPDTTGLNLPQYDITGNPRVFGGRIDMGAYENQNVYVKINDSPVYSKIKLYPNPGTDKIYIDIPPEMNGAWIDIIDGQGRVLMHEQISFSPAILSPYKLQSGIYFYRIYNENKVVKSGKWVKR